MRRLLIGVLGSLFVATGVLAQAPPPPPPPPTGGVIIDGPFGPVGGIAGQTPTRDNQQPAKPGTATLRGRVTAGDTGEPLRKAQVRITSAQPAAGQPPENRLTTTDASGRYEFKDVRAGRYNINAQKGSFVGLSWGQQRPNEPGKPLDVGDGQTIERVDFALPRGGVITGRILDEFGDAISDVQVSAMRYQTVNGGRRLINAGRFAQTNDIEKKANEYLAKIDALGGMLKAIERGYVQQEIQNAAYEFQQAVDTNSAIVVGVNEFQLEDEKAIAIQRIDEALERNQLERLRALRARRDQKAWEAALAVHRPIRPP